MTIFERRSVLALCVLCAVLPLSAAGAGRIENADQRRLEISSDLTAQVERLQQTLDRPAWLAYTVPLIDDEHSMCCFDNRRGGRAESTTCRLESRNRSFGHSSDDNESSERGTIDLRVLLRIDSGRVDEVRAYTTDCSLDAGGVVFYNLVGVRPAESIRFLGSLVHEGARGRSAEGAIMAIAHHDDAAADAALKRLASSDTPRELRKKSIFWIGIARAESGLTMLRQVLIDETDRDVLEHTIFAISQNDAPDAVKTLIRVARRNSSSELRSKALFWLGQMAGQEATRTIREAVDEDPNAEVRKQAVFALSQLPADQGVPLLIELARTNPHREVRKTAMFWLGQSDDSRALDLFEEILSH
jgi:hypothetical protein